MTIYRGYQFRIYLTIEQRIQINKNIGSALWVYNYFLKRKEEYYNETRKNLSLKEMKHELVNMTHKKSSPWFETRSGNLVNQEISDELILKFHKYETI